eukprot:Platyproteum_vivax@DN14372_c0_g1_i1.p1
MVSNFTDFGDLVLIIGDFHIPNRAVDIPKCFQELLQTDKIRHVLCTGNVGNEKNLEMLKTISGSVHVVKGDEDSTSTYPEYKVIDVGEFKVGLIHGHQIVPWSEEEVLQ